MPGDVDAQRQRKYRRDMLKGSHKVTRITTAWLLCQALRFRRDNFKLQLSVLGMAALFGLFAYQLAGSWVVAAPVGVLASVSVFAVTIYAISLADHKREQLARADEFLHMINNSRGIRTELLEARITGIEERGEAALIRVSAAQVHATFVDADGRVMGHDDLPVDSVSAVVPAVDVWRYRAAMDSAECGYAVVELADAHGISKWQMVGEPITLDFPSLR